MIYPKTFESKLGFDEVRALLRGRCLSTLGKDMVDAMAFSDDPATINEWLAQVREFRRLQEEADDFPLSYFFDVRQAVARLRLEGTHLDEAELFDLRRSLDTICAIVAYLNRGEATDEGEVNHPYPALHRLTDGVQTFPQLVQRIDQILDRFGEVRDTASDELLSIRKALKDTEGAISRRAASILKRIQEEGLADKDAAVSVREGKLLIPVPAVNKRKVPGFIYDESSSGKTAFIEPAELVELDNRIKELKFAENREILKILTEFTDFLRPYIPDLLFASEYLGEVDFLMAKANVALDIVAGMPILSSTGEMSIRKARHPLLEKALKREKKEIVPLTVTLTDKKRILMISGPNAGGKSVCLKTVGLLQYMFQWGMLIPTSETSEMLVFDRIMVEIGDDQSIDNDLSTYSSFLVNMKNMLQYADDRTLVLIDEFGSGTEPAAGGAIAEAILAELDRRGSYGVITTHYTNLKLYASREDTHVQNGAMMFDVQNIAPLFRLETGLPGNSFAFELARKTGLPENIIRDAEERAGDEFVGIERNLRKIARNRKALDEKLERIRNTDRTLENITDKYQKELLEIRKRKKEILDEATREAREIVAGANRQVENTIKTIREAQAEKEITKEARKELQNFVAVLTQQKEQQQKEKDDYIERKIRQIDERRERERKRKLQRADERTRKEMEAQAEEQRKLEEFRNAPLQPGEKVRIKDTGMVGEISKVSAKTLMVNIGNITSKVSPDKVERITSNEFREAVKAVAPKVSAVRIDSSITERKLNFSPELDVRGERLNDAIEKVTRYVDDAVMLGIPSVRIIHGKGTGVLREEIQKMLRSMPGIEKVADEHIQFGGTGVTIVTFY